MVELELLCVQSPVGLNFVRDEYSNGLDMKIPGSDAVDNNKPRASEQSTARRSSAEVVADQNPQQSAQARSKSDSIKVSSLGSFLQSALNPSKMAEERTQKIEALKEQIRNGTYNPSSEAVARSLGEELYLEIALAGDQKE